MKKLLENVLNPIKESGWYPKNCLRNRLEPNRRNGRNRRNGKRKRNEKKTQTIDANDKDDKTETQTKRKRNANETQTKR